MAAKYPMISETKWYHQEDNETYSSFEMLQIYKAISELEKTKKQTSKKL
jgi:hypothetical protein